MILVGQPELLATLARPELNQFSERVVAYCAMKPLSQEETIGYIRHRLTRAGGRPDLFTGDTCRLIYRHSRGVPPLVNLLCGTALTYAYVQEAEQVGSEQVHDVLNDGAAGLSMGTRTASAAVSDRASPGSQVSEPVPQCKQEQGEPQIPPQSSPTPAFGVDDARRSFSTLAKRRT